MKSNMPPQKDFSKVPSIGGIQRSVFNRSHSHKTTFDTGDIVPFYIDEILPGDSQTVNANVFCRLSSSLDFPIMDNLHVDTFYFFVPNRILWDNWEKFMGAQDNPGDSIAFTVPEVTCDETAPGQLMNYLGVPSAGTRMNDNKVNSLHARAYIKIFNEWFRSQDLMNSVTEFSGDGPEPDTSYPIQTRLKRHDYFTSCLPNPQKGSAAVGISLTGVVPVQGVTSPTKTIGLTDGTLFAGMYNTTAGNGDMFVDTSLYDVAVGTADTNTRNFGNIKGIGLTTDGTKSGMEADLSSATAILINDLRLAVATQQFLELNSRGGTRYVELIKAHFGVVSPDYRLQRPEYLGGGSFMMNVNPNTQTTATPAVPTSTDAAGQQSAYVTGSSRSGYSKSFVEHGVILGLINVRADLTYQQGNQRMLNRQDRLDFYFPTFANLGEQAVLNKEIWHNDDANDDLVFGYQERWAEYRYYPSRISGQFTSDVASPLDAWHLAQDFTGLPTLGSTFLKEAVPMSRIMAVAPSATIPEIIMDSFIEIKHARPMPVFSVPGLDRL